MVKIEYVKWGLANKFDDPEVIELSESLKQDPSLHDAILSHELGHKKHNSFKQDFKHDLTPVNRLSQKKLLFFMFKHPRTLTQFLPFYWSSKRKQIIYDLNMLLIYGGIFFFVILAIYFSGKI